MASGLGGHKGEGIAAIGVNYEAGRGALANGGGGGNNTNAGGAGGGNYGTGGRGGDQYQGCATTPLGGEIGNALTYSNAQNKIFLGGGGGGGHQNDNKGTAGTAGGGIIIIKANAIVANNFSLLSDGVNNTLFLGNDGAGGGGAGGTILLDIINYSSILKVQAKGGNGGNNDAPGCHGPGGGGGGGVIWLNGAMLPNKVSAIYNGGTSGITNCNGTSYGASSGALGGIVYNLQLVQSNIPASTIPTITVSPDPAVICNGDSVSLTANGATSYLWSNGLGNTNSIKVKPVSTTTYTVTGSMAGCTGTKNITVKVNPNPAAPTATLIQPSCSEAKGTITIIAPKGIGITYSIDGLTYDNKTGIFSLVASNTYSITAMSTDRCISKSTSIIINAKPNCLPVAVNDTLITNEKAPVTRNVSINDTSGNGNNVWSLVGVNGGAVNGNVSMNPDGTYTYTPGVNFLGSDTFTYQVCDVDEDCSTATVLVKINKNPEVFVPNVFTPNGDGIHDLFKIVGLDGYENPELQIFNRYGNLIFKKDHYGNLDIWKNEELAWWNGRSEHKWNVINDKSPVGTYYYILKLGDGKVLTGFVFLAK
jgi:gliding motility-associated-like protein